MEEILAELPIPTFQQFLFLQIAGLIVVGSILVITVRNLFHAALSLVLTLFGIAGIYVMLEAEFVAVSQILVYIGGITTLITFAIMLTRNMMFGNTSQNNRQVVASISVVGTIFSVLAGLMWFTPWPELGAELPDGEIIIATLGSLFVTTYLIPFELMALLLLVALAGALLLARDRT